LTSRIGLNFIISFLNLKYLIPNINQKINETIALTNHKSGYQISIKLAVIRATKKDVRINSTNCRMYFIILLKIFDWLI
jgi:hypothetical protein